MPKIIADLGETLLKEARRMILEEGYEAFNMRAVAAKCAVAVGTVYNYYSSKEMLAAAVMLEDWKTALVRMEACARDAQDALGGLRGIFAEIVAFRRIYESAWLAYAGGGRAVALRGDYHDLLVAQLSGVTGALLARFGCVYAPVLPAFLAENLLSAAAYGDERFEALAPVLARLL